jgi:hypothetical protein
MHYQDNSGYQVTQDSAGLAPYYADQAKEEMAAMASPSMGTGAYSTNIVTTKVSETPRWPRHWANSSLS